MVDSLRKEKNAVTKRVDKLREGMECTGYDRNGLEAKLQRAQREREKCADAVHLVQNCVGKLQGLVRRDPCNLQKRMKKH